MDPLPSCNPPFLREPGTSPSADRVPRSCPARPFYPPAFFLQGQMQAGLPSLPSPHRPPSSSAGIYLHPTPLRKGCEAWLLIGNPRLAFSTGTYIWAFLGEPQCQIPCFPTAANAWQNNNSSHSLWTARTEALLWGLSTNPFISSAR